MPITSPPCSTVLPYTTLFRSAVQGGADSHAHGPGSHRDRCQPQPFGGEPVHLRGELHRHRAERGDEVQQLRGCARSEEHTSELQSRLHLVCRLLLEKKKSRRI